MGSALSTERRAQETTQVISSGRLAAGSQAAAFPVIWLWPVILQMVDGHRVHP